jgi:hypothetical protein
MPEVRRYLQQPETNGFVDTSIVGAVNVSSIGVLILAPIEHLALQLPPKEDISHPNNQHKRDKNTNTREI